MSYNLQMDRYQYTHSYTLMLSNKSKQMQKCMRTQDFKINRNVIPYNHNRYIAILMH